MIKKEKYSEKRILKLVIVLVILSGLWFSFIPPLTEGNHREIDGKMYCTEESRLAEFCIEVWDPVCGSNGKTYSNSCFACMDPEVIYFTEGEC